MIPNNVTSLGTGCITYSKVSEIELGDQVTAIGTYAFEFNSKLTYFVIRTAQPPTLGTRIFNGIATPEIYVPDASVDIYKSASGWSAFSAKIRGISEL